jgi:hypothetical protein
VIAEHGTDHLVLLVADTRVEDPDLWRFVHDSTVHIGVQPTIVADGRTPFQVFHDQRFIVLSPNRQLSELIGDHGMSVVTERSGRPLYGPAPVRLNARTSASNVRTAS